MYGNSPEQLNSNYNDEQKSFVLAVGGEECRAVQTIGDEGQTLNIGLTEGTYSVYAVGGASSSDYVLPTTDDAAATSAIALREGHSHGDLMAAQATATLTDYTKGTFVYSF